MDLPELWTQVVEYALSGSLREYYEYRAQEWEAQARQIDENTPEELLDKLFTVNPDDNQIIQKDDALPEDTLVHLKRTNKQLCHLVNVTASWWKRVFRSFYNSDTWYNTSRFTSYQEALNVLKKVSRSAKQSHESRLQQLTRLFECDKLCCMKEDLLYYIHQGQILSKRLADLSESPNFICKCPQGWSTPDFAILDIFILKEDIIGLNIMRNHDRSGVFVTKEGAILLNSEFIIDYYDEDFVMLSWWDERRVLKLPDLVQCFEAIDLTPLQGTRLIWGNAEFSYLSRTDQFPVSVLKLSQASLRDIIDGRQHTGQELLEARLKDDMTKKSQFYVNDAGTHYLVHDIYAREGSYTLNVCDVEWASSVSNLVQNVALVKNRLWLMMRQEVQNVLPNNETSASVAMTLCFVDL